MLISTRRKRMQDDTTINRSRRWHFDALSDDGRDAVIVEFTDNYHLSPRAFSGQNGPIPAVSFRYFSDGKLVLSSINEVAANGFARDAAGVSCVVGDSFFRVDTTAYGTGFMVSVDIIAARRRRIRAEIEWLSVEAGGSETVEQPWKMSAPRSDVSGRITLVGRRGAIRKLIQFRGTGYADEIVNTPDRRAWGRAHFVDATAIFELTEKGDGENRSKLYLVRDGDTHERETNGDLQNVRRDRYGLMIPGRILLTSTDNIRLRVKPLRVIQSGFFEARTLSENTLMLRDGKPRKTTGFVEFSEPERLKNPFFRWISDLRIGKNGKPPLL